MPTTATTTRGPAVPPLAEMLRQRTWRFLGAALTLLLAATAACGPSEPEHLGASSHVHRSLNPEWRVAPSIEEQIFRSTTIVRATLQSATAAVETLPSDPGVAPTYQAVQELRFTVHEYLKGSGVTSLLVVVRGGHGYQTEAEARDFADYQVQARVTTWDERQAVLFLEAPSSPYTQAAAGGEAAGSSETTSPVVLQFTRSNYGQPPWAYSVDTLRPAWLPAENMPAEGEAPTAFITDGAQSPSPTITLADLRAQIAALAAELQAGAGVEGFRDCILGRIGLERYHRADPWAPYQETGALTSGAAAGTGGSRSTDGFSGSRYSRYWLSGPDAALFRSAIVDDDGQPSSGYTHQFRSTRPLPAGEYRVHYRWQHYEDFACNFVRDDAYDDFTVTVTAPAGTVHEAFFDPAALGRGVVGRDAAHGVLAPAAVGTASGAAGAAASSGASGTSATLRRLTWDAGQLRLDVTGATLAGQQLELIRLDGTVGLTLRGDAATATATAGGHELRWPVCTQPWQPGERLMLRISAAPAGDPPAAPACPGVPALPTVTADTTAPAAGAPATLTAAVPSDAGAATYQWQRDVGGVWTPVAAAGAAYQARAFTAMTGTWRVQARYASGALAHSAPVTLTWPAAATPPCRNGVTVPTPTANTGLVQDCTALLAARDALAGPGRLNWDGSRALSAWTGVTLGGAPQRVTGLRLGAQGLIGPVPAALGDLTHLTALDLRGNALTGELPTALGALTRLTDLHLAGTRLTGCLPAPLAGVATTDAAAQGLSACQAGPAFDAPRYAWIVPAGLPVGAAVGQVQATDPDDGTVTYALTAGNAGGGFQLDATTGVLSVAGALPAGGAGLTVTATDAQGSATRVPVVVAVEDAARRAPPVFPAAGWSFRVAEAAAVSTVVGTAAARDLDGGPLTYALTAGATAGAFALDPSSGLLTVAGPLDYATTPSYTLTLTATDPHGGTATTTVSITVTDVIYTPVFAAAPYSFTVDEIAAVGTTVGLVRATDPEGRAVTHSLAAGNEEGTFAIDAATGTLTLARALDYATTPDYALTVTASTAEGGMETAAVTIAVTDYVADYDADADGLIEVASLAQLHAIRWDLDGNGVAADPGYAAAFPHAAAGMGCPADGCTGYELTADLDFDTSGDGAVDAADAYWNGGAGWAPLGVAGGPPFTGTLEGNGHTITRLLIARPADREVGLLRQLGPRGEIRNLGLRDVAVTGGTETGGLVGEIRQGTVRASSVSGRVAGTGVVGGLVGYNQGGAITASYATSAVRGQTFHIGGLLGWNLRGTVQASYARGPVTGGGWTGGLVGTSQGGAITASYALGAVTGSSAVGGLVGTGAGTVTASYWDTTTTGQAHSAGGAGHATAALQAPTGYTGLYAAWNLDLDGDGASDQPWDFGTAAQYPVLRVDANGDGQATWQELGAQRVVNRAPAFAEGAAATRSVAAGTAEGVHIGAPLTAADPDGGTPTYALGGADAAAFGLDATTGQLKTKAALDAATRASYAVTVTASDNAGAQAVIAVTIRVTDPPPAPANLAATAAVTSLALTWDAVTGASAYRVDARASGAADWTSAADDLTATTHTLAELPCATAYHVRVSAFGDGTIHTAAWGAASTALTAATGACPPPAFEAAPYSFSVSEAAAVDTLLGTVTGTTTSTAPVTYALTAGNDAGSFAINASTGALTVAGALDAATTSAYTLTVQAGAGGASATTDVTVTVTSGALVPPPAPQNVAATPAATSLELTWDAVAGVSAYRVESRASGAADWTTAADKLTATTHTLADLACGTAYEARVSASGDGTTHAAVWGAASAVQTAATDACPPPAVTAAFGAAAYTVAESAATGVTVTVTLSAVPERKVIIPLKVTLQGGAEAADTTGVPASVTLAATATTVSFAVIPVNDTVDDDGESVQLGFGPLPSGVTAGDVATTTITIQDDDDAPRPVPGVRLSTDQVTLVEGASAAVTVRLAVRPRRGQVRVQVRTQAGADLSMTPVDLVFTAATWDQPQTVTLTARTDADAEGAETHKVNVWVVGADDLAYHGLPKTTIWTTVTDAATTSALARPPPPYIQSAGVAGTTVTLALSATPGVANWRIESRVGADAAWTVAADVSAVESAGYAFAGAAGTTYEFRARASGDGTTYTTDWSDPSNVVTASIAAGS